MRSDTKPLSKESLDDYSRRIVSLVTEFESLSDGHIRWFTHKNPYGCWICDLLQCFRDFVEAVHDYEQAEMNKPKGKK